MFEVTVTDPLGRTVTLHDRPWFGHIVKGHPEVASHRDLVEQAIAQPDAIHRSATDPY